MSSPTQLSLKELRKTCDLVQVVEVWNHHAFIRQDLFGIIDILAIRGGDTIAVQCTSRGNMNARIRKMSESDALPHLRKAGWTILAHGWAKRKVKRGGVATRNELMEVDLS